MNELLSTGIEVMLLGMGIVYSFLALLIVAIKTMSAVMQRYFPELPVSHPQHGAVHGDDPGTVAAIAAAVHQYRMKHHKPHQ